MATDDAEVFVPIQFDDSTMLCPRCRCTYLHQGPVIVFERDTEDSAGNVVRVDHLRVETRRAPDARLPGRRNTLRVGFYCEDCHASESSSAWSGEPHWLEIMQHKGQTLVRWLEPGESPEGR
jgi:hypothetical protein